MMVLRMVEEGKITADEAERLIAALEGDHEG
jgi:polyhydroxyalkanoate synthesis regulator phasin